MFEFAFAWALFTLVIGKSAEAVVHAWKGTAPPGHVERMARIRAREAAAHRKAAEKQSKQSKPSEGFRGWARTTWVDAWNAAADRHAERWPAKAAKKKERARARHAWWDHVEDEAGRRWEARRAERAEEKGRRAAEGRESPEQPEKPAEKKAEKKKEEKEGDPGVPRGQEEQVRQAEERAERARAEADRLRAQAAQDRADAERARRNVGVEEELARAEAERDAASKRAYEAERRAEGARAWARVAEREARESEERAATAEKWARAAEQAARARTDHHDNTPDDGGDDIVDAEIVEDIPQIEAGRGGRQAADTTTIEEDAMSNDTTEAIGLDGALAWAQGAVATSTANATAAEQVAAAMESGKVGSGPVGRTQQLMDSFAASQAIAQALVADLERMQQVQESYDANPDAGDKDYLTSGR